MVVDEVCVIDSVAQYPRLSDIQVEGQIRLLLNKGKVKQKSIYSMNNELYTGK